MLQVYTFTGCRNMMNGASADVVEKVNNFLTKGTKANWIEVTQFLQSESQNVSIREGRDDWSHSLTITLVVKVPENAIPKVQELYASCRQ